MARILLFNKPFRVLSQFSADGDKQTLADYIDEPGVYPAGRLDYDSEGLMLLTDDGGLQARLTFLSATTRQEDYILARTLFNGDQNTLVGFDDGRAALPFSAMLLVRHCVLSSLGFLTAPNIEPRP